MIGLDTNIVVRLLTGDDEQQTRQAKQMVEGENLWLAKTVLLETQWVLRSAYGLSRQSIVGSFHKLLGYPLLVVEARAEVLRAVDWYEQGLDFADALHLASLGPADRLVTFDVKFARRVRHLADAPTVLEI